MCRRSEISGQALVKARGIIEERIHNGLRQCSKEVWDKLKASNDWDDKIQKAQSLHELIAKVEKIGVGFADHKQEVFNLVQSLKTLFLYTQSEKDTVEEYGCNFRSLWDTVEVFSGGRRECTKYSSMQP